MGEVSKDPDKKRRKAVSKVCISAWASFGPGQLERSLPFLFVVMAAVSVSVSSQPWQRPFYIYGGLTCNSLMAGKFFSLFLGPIWLISVVLEGRYRGMQVGSILEQNSLMQD